MNPSNELFDCQKFWWRLEDRLGKKDAIKYLANALREAADQVESNGYPMVFGCETKSDPDPIYGEPFIWTVSVTLSYPWPG